MQTSTRTKFLTLARISAVEKAEGKADWSYPILKILHDQQDEGISSYANLLKPPDRREDWTSALYSI